MAIPLIISPYQPIPIHVKELSAVALAYCCQNKIFVQRPETSYAPNRQGGDLKCNVRFDNIRTLFPANLGIDEMLIHRGGYVRILKRYWP